VGVLAVLVVIGLVVIARPRPVVPPPVDVEVLPWPGYPDPEFTWIGQSRMPAGNFFYESSARVAENITRASGGRLVLKLEPGGAIVPAAKEFDGIHKGLLDWADTCYMFWKHLFPAAGLFTMKSGEWTPTEALLWFTAGDGGALAREMIEDFNVVIFDGGGTLLTPEVFLHTNTPIKTVDDLKGLKVRAAGDGAAILARLGVGVIFIPVGEIFEAMRLGVIDGFEASSPALNWWLGLHEVGKYLYLSPVRQPYEFNPFLVNRARWEKLPGDLRQIVKSEFEAEAMRMYAITVAKDMKALEKFEEAGVIVKHLPPEVEAAWEKAAQEFYADLAGKDAFAARVIESYLSFMERFRELWPPPVPKYPH
jgi:TRAP-type mannitol/chloroaromatic compound transport system substrate-binding protein